MRARTIGKLTVGAGAAIALFSAATHARAQAAGVAQAPLPNVLLLVDTSGSMERMVDGSLPGDKPGTACTPGVASTPNRWATLIQALTGNMQPFSCAKMDRAANGALSNEYAINNIKPYDTDYFLPHHRPLSGAGVSACAISPWRLPGGSGKGPGPSNQASTDLVDGKYVDGFPNDALRSVLYSEISSKYPGTTGGTAIPFTSATACDVLQADDGQLDAARDYVRFAMMTFDQDTDAGTGVTAPSGGLVGPDPFKGQWSYLRATGIPAQGKPGGCATLSDFEVGARHWGAPPWEGRLVRFPDPFGSLADIERTNDQIQTVLTASRPYGATPIDAMLDDARDYLFNHPEGPGKTDPYVKGKCRRQFNILLTDGAPNLAMRTSCEGAGPPAGVCPYPGSVVPTPGIKQSIAWDIVDHLYKDDPLARIPTFVIGFAVEGSSTTIPNQGFPASFAPAEQNCTFWFNDATGKGFSKNSAAMSTYCRGGSAPPVGSTADACCQLNEIAYYGSGGTAPPYFADSQQALINAFGQVLAQITQSASTRTTPAYTATQAQSGGKSLTGSFTAAFVPNPRKPWSGKLDRYREQCDGAGSATAVTPASPDSNKGDSFHLNLAKQAADGNRLFITVVGDQAGAGADSFRTMRPFVAGGTAPDLGGAITTYRGQEFGKLDMGILADIQAGNSNSSTVNLVPALGIDKNTCKKTRDSTGLLTVPALDAKDCSDVVWRFASASITNPPLGTPAYSGFNVRCKLGSNTCAVTGAMCTVDADCDGPPPKNKGDVCVPACAALGAIFRSTPATAAAPNSLNRDEGYRIFADARATRSPALFVATTDGVLHGFKSLDEAGVGGRHELWAFVPPAVLPKLASNYPAGQQILLDGSPIVKDVVWDRDRTQLSEARQWHTTLVAGMGSNGPGYFGMNVTDVDCGSTFCDATKYQAPAKGSLEAVSAAGKPGDPTCGTGQSNCDYPLSQRGPHFLWQLTDVERLAGDPVTLPTVRKARAAADGGDGKEFVAMFGRQTGTPAITTLLYAPVSGQPAREIGVAILPGGLDGPPSKTGTCPRSGAPDISDTNWKPRANVRQWSSTACSGGTPLGGPVAGRSVTIVRLDTGEIVRHFGRTLDTPSAIQTGGRFTATNFDSPITGVPLAFPSDVGSVATRAFVGDADGTMWRLDLSAPDPADWKVSLFQDLFPGAGTPGTDGQPIVVPPVASLDPVGNVVLNVATGEQENLVASSAYNRVFSIVEGKPVGGSIRSEVRWFIDLKNGERVTGPMAVFDGTLFFATYLPEPLSGVCATAAKPFIFALDYFRPIDVLDASKGALKRYPPGLAETRPIEGGADVSVAYGNVLIPGLAIKQSLICADQSGSGTTDYFGKVERSVKNTQPPTFSLAIPVAKGVAGSIVPQKFDLPNPRTPTTVDSWALVID